MAALAWKFRLDGLNHDAAMPEADELFGFGFVVRPELQARKRWLIWKTMV